MFTPKDFGLTEIMGGIVDVIRAYLVREGYTVDVARDGDAARRGFGKREIVLSEFRDRPIRGI